MQTAGESLVVRVALGTRAYDIEIVSANAAGVGGFARQRHAGKLALVVCDEHVGAHADAVADALFVAGFKPALAIVPAGEKHKSLPMVSHLYDKLAHLGAGRDTLVVAVGGGVIGDLAGFVAASYMRGLALLMVPTSLLAMVDSSVGGKVGVNHPKAKNLIGAFHQPIGVWIDTAMLATLPEREYRSGLAEIIKYGVVFDPELLAFLDGNVTRVLACDDAVVRHLVARSCRQKADVVERDEREESGLRALLNYGHTFAHAFETVAGYGTWLHGEAVAAGMICASRLAQRRGLIDASLTERQIALLRAFGLPTQPGQWPADDLLRTMRSDKKNLGGRLRFVLPRGLGSAGLFDDVDEADVRAVLNVSA